MWRTCVQSDSPGAAPRGGGKSAVLNKLPYCYVTFSEVLMNPVISTKSVNVAVYEATWPFYASVRAIFIAAVMTGASFASFISTGTQIHLIRDISLRPGLIWSGEAERARNNHSRVL